MSTCSAFYCNGSLMQKTTDMFLIAKLLGLNCLTCIYIKSFPKYLTLLPTFALVSSSLLPIMADICV